MDMGEVNVIPASAKEPIIIAFTEGIYGFEDIKEYVLLQEDDSNTIWSLQAAHSSIPSFIVVNPYLVMADYSPILSASDLKAIGMPAEEDICFLVITVLKEKFEDSVVNLKSPIVINVRTRQAKQIILENNDYPIRCKLFVNLK